MATRRVISSVYPQLRALCQSAKHGRTVLFNRAPQLNLNSKYLHTSVVRLDKAPHFEIINIQDDQHFEEHVINSKIPVILDFHATWCGPCKLLAPRLEKVLSNHSKSVNLVKVDVDKFEDLAIKYKVQGVPAIYAVKDGKIVDKFVGLKEEDIIEGFVERLTS